ncbi:MAG: hypothetical protein ACOCYW_01170 [Roseicyclus sp.]
MNFKILLAPIISVVFFAEPVVASPVATFEVGAQWSISLTSAISLEDGSSVSLSKANPAHGFNDEAYAFAVGDMVSTSPFVDEDTWAGWAPNGIAGYDSVADGIGVWGSGGFESVGAWGYRSECDIEIQSNPKDCSDDSGALATFTYNYQPFAHNGSVQAFISFYVANHSGTNPVSVLRYATNTQSGQRDRFSGSFYVVLKPGMAFSKVANVNFNGSANLVAPPAPVPLPAPVLMLLTGVVALRFVGSRRSLRAGAAA